MYWRHTTWKHQVERHTSYHMIPSHESQTNLWRCVSSNINLSSVCLSVCLCVAFLLQTYHTWISWPTELRSSQNFQDNLFLQCQDDQQSQISLHPSRLRSGTMIVLQVWTLRIGKKSSWHNSDYAESLNDSHK